MHSLGKKCLYITRGIHLFTPYHLTGPSSAYPVQRNTCHLWFFVTVSCYRLNKPGCTMLALSLSKYTCAADDSTVCSFYYGTEFNLIWYEADQEHQKLRSFKTYKLEGGSCGENRCAGKSLSTDSAGSIGRPGTAHASSEGEESALSAGSKCVKEKVKGHIIVSTSTMIQPLAA